MHEDQIGIVPYSNSTALRRASRHLASFYDRALAPTGKTGSPNRRSERRGKRLLAGTKENPIVCPRFDLPETVGRQPLTVGSQGMALDADSFRPKASPTDATFPGAAMSRGIGGDGFTCERYAAKPPSVGFVALYLTLREGRIMTDGALVDAGGPEAVTASRRMIRQLIDPLDWIEGFRSALDDLEGAPNLGVSRLGVWDTSQGGAAAFHARAADNRTKARAILGPALDFPPSKGIAAPARQRRFEVARGRISPIPQGEDAHGNLVGTPYSTRMTRVDGMRAVDAIDVPTLTLDAANEASPDQPNRPWRERRFGASPGSCQGRVRIGGSLEVRGKA